MNESFSTAADMSRVSSQKFSTLNVKRDHFVPKVKKKEFLNTYFFVSPWGLFLDETSQELW